MAPRSLAREMPLQQSSCSTPKRNEMERDGIAGGCLAFRYGRMLCFALLQVRGAGWSDSLDVKSHPMWQDKKAATKFSTTDICHQPDCLEPGGAEGWRLAIFLIYGGNAL